MACGFGSDVQVTGNGPPRILKASDNLGAAGSVEGYQVGGAEQGVRVERARTALREATTSGRTPACAAMVTSPLAARVVGAQVETGAVSALTTAAAHQCGEQGHDNRHGRRRVDSSASAASWVARVQCVRRTQCRAARAVRPGLQQRRGRRRLRVPAPSSDRRPPRRP